MSATARSTLDLPRRGSRQASTPQAQECIVPPRPGAPGARQKPSRTGRFLQHPNNHAAKITPQPPQSSLQTPNSPVCVSVLDLRNKRMQEKLTLRTIPALQILDVLGEEQLPPQGERRPFPGGCHALPPGVPLPGSEGRGLLKPVSVLLRADDHGWQEWVSVLGVWPAHLTDPKLSGL